MKKQLVRVIFTILIKPVLWICNYKIDFRNILSEVLSNHLALLIWIIENNNKPERNNFKTKVNQLNNSKLKEFEDLAFMFNCNHSNRGIVALDFDEAALIFSTIRNNNINSILEIGRFLGGSTLLISVAKTDNAYFYSVDLKVKAPEYADDKVILEAVSKTGKKNIEFIVGDSTKYIPPQKIDFVFIDGDHSYEGVKNDYLNIEKYLNNGAHVLFHDSVSARPFSTKDYEVEKFMIELKNNIDLKKIGSVGSITHYLYKAN